MSEQIKMRNNFQKAADWIRESDGIIVCAANGFSISEGFAILRPSRWFSDNFQDYIQKYGIQTPLQGLNYPYRDPESFSKFYTRLMKGIHYDKPVSSIMKTLQQITEHKPAYIVTTNAEDRFVQAGYPEQNVFYLEGRFTHRTNHEPIPEEELSSIQSPQQLETAVYPGSPAFNRKLNNLNAFLNKHPRFVILVLGVSAGNGYLRPLIQQMMQIYPASRLVELNLDKTHTFADPNRILDLEGNLEESLEKVQSDLSR